MIRCTILTPWFIIVDPELDPELKQDDRNAPQVFQDHPLTAGCSWTDITSQPVENLIPDPNLYTLQAVITQEILDAINADPTYLVLSEDTI